MSNSTREVIFDAKGEKLGRAASKVASLVLAKDETDFAKNKVTTKRVVVINIDNLHISEKKSREVIYYRHSGYPGALKQESLGKRIEKRGREKTFLEVVKGMLPDNKLRLARLKRIDFR